MQFLTTSQDTVHWAHPNRKLKISISDLEIVRAKPVTVMFCGAELGASDSFVHVGQVSGPLVRYVLSFSFITFKRRLLSNSLYNLVGTVPDVPSINNTEV